MGQTAGKDAHTPTVQGLAAATGVANLSQSIRGTNGAAGCSAPKCPMHPHSTHRLPAPVRQDVWLRQPTPKAQHEARPTPSWIGVAGLSPRPKPTQHHLASAPALIARAWLAWLDAGPDCQCSTALSMPQAALASKFAACAAQNHQRPMDTQCSKLNGATQCCRRLQLKTLRENSQQASGQQDILQPYRIGVRPEPPKKDTFLPHLLPL